MKQEISIEAGISAGSELLAEVARVLSSRLPPPECFVWSVIPDSEEARIWMIVCGDETELRELTANLGKVQGVRRVGLGAPGDSIREALVL